MRPLLIAGLLVLLFAPGGPAQAQEEPDVDPAALEILQGMIGHLGDSSTFRLRADSGYDVLQDNGQMLEFGGVREVLVDKPNRARFDLARRDGFRASLILDGETLWYVTPEEKTYGSLPQPGNLDEALDYAQTELGLSEQLADFVALDPYRGLEAALEFGSVIGPAEIMGVPCTHLAFRNDFADFQVWIASTGDPILKRLVITYREEPGQPQFWANVTELDDEVEPDSAAFSFEPPEDYVRVPFLVPTPADTDADLD